MARKIRTTRPELKRQRDLLARYERFLPMLKLKQQQLQIARREVVRKRAEASEHLRSARAAFQRYEAVTADTAGLAVRALAEPQELKTSSTNVAGVTLPVLQNVVFARPVYSLFGTPPWVDRAIRDLQDINRRRAELDVCNRQHELLARELTRVVQRVNLFEKVKIPESQEAIRVIRIRLGDEMTAAVGRAKIAKTKLADIEERASDTGEAGNQTPPETPSNPPAPENPQP